jgi:Rrf2 family protein
MIELALADQDKGMLQKEIAKNQCISEKYLDHIISALKVSGLIKNVKGKKSGYRLTRDSGGITVNDIFMAFDSKLIDLECFDHINICNRVDLCAARDFWGEYESVLENFLMSVTLEKIAGNEVKKRTENSLDGMYYI